MAVKAAVDEARRLGHAQVGSEDLLWSLFQNTKKDSRARYWLGKQRMLNSGDLLGPRDGLRCAVGSVLPWGWVDRVFGLSWGN